MARSSGPRKKRAKTKAGAKAEVKKPLVKPKAPQAGAVGRAPDPVVEAEIDSDLPRMEEIVKSCGEGHPLCRYYSAIRDSRAVLGKPEPERRAAVRRLAELVDDPPGDRELFQVLLERLVRLGLRAGFPGEARRALRLLEQSAAEGSCRPEVLALTRLCRSAIEFFNGDYSAAFENATQALAAAGPERSRLWFMLKANRVTLAIQDNRLDVAEADLALVERPPTPPGILLGPVEALRLQVLDAQERHAEALALLNRVTGGSLDGEHGRFAADRVRLMIKVGRGREALELLEKHRDKVTPFQYEMQHGIEASLRGDFAAARRHLQRSVGVPGVRPRDLNHAAWALSSVELNDRRPRAARKILSTIDPEESSLQYAMEWARLHWQEGNPARAAGHFRRILEQGRREHISNVLVDVQEMGAHEVGLIWRMAMIPADAREARALAGLDGDSAAEGQGSRPGTATRPGPTAPPARRTREAVLVGDSPAMRRIRAEVARFAPLDETVLVTGETGTGKELVARLLHDSGPRGKEPFLAVNCAAISDTLLESELFGHVRGAFTGAVRDHDGLLVAAGRGTLLFDEIDSMSPRVQGSLLRVLEERKVRPVGGARDREFHARVIAAGSTALAEKVRAGEFRSDLYYRLARLELALPALRDRPGDIPDLARHFLEEQFESGELVLGDDLLEELRRRSWPGNVRELRNEIQRLVILAGERRTLGAELLRAPLELPAEALTPTPLPAGEGRGVREGPAAAAPAPAPARKVPRRDRLGVLRELFSAHRELSRGDVAHLLPCAPATAAKLLARLESEGLVERVDPTPSPRTSYYALKGQP
jgi:DNA-binding NtrC family response regulator